MGRDHEADFAIVVPPDDLEAELDDGLAGRGRWLEGPGGHRDPLGPGNRDLLPGDRARSSHRRDELRLSRIGLDDRTAAFDLCILHRDRLYLLKTGFDEDFRRLAPGLVMRLSIIERCFELGLRSHELLGGESEWKAKFADLERAARQPAHLPAPSDRGFPLRVPVGGAAEAETRLSSIQEALAPWSGAGRSREAACD